MSAQPARNLLGDETSPYLLQHKDNPVHWRPWTSAALAEAKAANKPILLSSGYSACHWCHVMAHESFENAELADYLNAHFICIKLDREERPEIDQIYQSSLQAMGHQGGWPLTAFLTPDGDAFGGATYYPLEDKDGRPGFRTVLGNVVELWRDKQDDIATTTARVRETLAKRWASEEPKGINPQVIDLISRRIVQRIDLFYGGMEGSPKFPQVSALTLVWRAFMRTALNPFGQAIVTTLDNMCQGGIYDHLGGGFARYSTDERWFLPHFEKMLYDNAGMIELLTLVWQHTRSPLYAARVDETVDWVLREMVTKEGAFAAALDADSEGEEGKFYVWTEAEIDEVLGPNDAPMFKAVYGITKDGNWKDGLNVIHRLNAMPFLRPDQEGVLSRARRMLLMARAKRVRPQQDDKVLVDWNGMMIAAMAQAGAVFKKPEWHFAGVRAFWAIAEKLGEGDVLYHAFRDQRSRNETTAEGYAQMTRAALILYEFSSDQRYLDKAIAWMERVESQFRDPKGGYFFTRAGADDIPVRVRTSVDGSTPNYNAVLIECLARLSILTGQDKYRERFNPGISAFGAELERNPFGSPAMFNALEFVVSTAQIVVIGDERQPATQNLVRAVLDRSVPMRILTILKPGQKLPTGHPAQGKGQDGGKPTAYVCSRQNCSPPLTDPAVLFDGLLSQPFQRLAQMRAQQQQQVQSQPR